MANVIGQPGRAPEIRHSLTEGSEQAHAKLAAVCEGRPLMLLVDQFEELLTLCHDPGEQARFATILRALSDPGAAADGFTARILLTLRTDHLDRFERAASLVPLHRRLIGEHNSDQLSPSLGFDQIRRIIKEPADSVGLRFVPPELVDRLASQAAGLANGLPLLQFALQRLWETRPKPTTGSDPAGDGRWAARRAGSAGQSGRRPLQSLYGAGAAGLRAPASRIGRPRREL